MVTEISTMSNLKRQINFVKSIRRIEQENYIKRHIAQRKYICLIKRLEAQRAPTETIYNILKGRELEDL